MNARGRSALVARSSGEGRCPLLQAPGEMARQMALPRRHAVDAGAVVHRRARWGTSIVRIAPHRSGLVAAVLDHSSGWKSANSPRAGVFKGRLVIRFIRSM